MNWNLIYPKYNPDSKHIIFCLSGNFRRSRAILEELKLYRVKNELAQYKQEWLNHANRT